MFGFGFMDNLVMIQAGDLIDNSIGVAFGLATLTSAAYGQIVSDVTGTVSSGLIEALASSLGLRRAGLTTEQLSLRSVRISGTLGAAIGVALGCLAGMSCLLFMDLEKSERLKRQRELRTLYTTLMEEGHELIGAQHCSLFLLDRDAALPARPDSAEDDGLFLTSMGWKGNEPTDAELRRTFAHYDTDGTGYVTALQLYHALRLNGWTAELSDVERMIAEVDKDGDSMLSFNEFAALFRGAVMQDEVRLRVRPGGSRARVLERGEMMNVQNVNTDLRISDESRRRYHLRGYDVKSLLLAPVFDDDGHVIGLVELVNKGTDPAPASPSGLQRQGGEQKLVRRNTSDYGFTRDDEKLLAMLSKHCTIFLKHLDS
jgi:GAF domain-containing protein